MPLQDLAQKIMTLEYQVLPMQTLSSYILYNVCNDILHIKLRIKIIIWIKLYYISFASSFNIVGDCCGERLSDFNIMIGDSTKENGTANPLCVSHLGVPQGATKTFKCMTKLIGRYLYIKKNSPDPLTLCEVKVFGEFV